MNKHIYTFFSLLLAVFVSAQSLKSYKFIDFKTPNYVLKSKAKLDIKSNKTAKQFKTVLSENYKNGKIDFASYYITAIWGCGLGCINGAMVDVRDGRVYDLPISEKNTVGNCFSTPYIDDQEDRYEMNKQSALFLTSVCTEMQTNQLNKNVQMKTYFVYVWDEKNKKFSLVKRVTKKTMIDLKENN